MGASDANAELTCRDAPEATPWIGQVPELFPPGVCGNFKRTTAADKQRPRTGWHDERTRSRE